MTEPTTTAGEPTWTFIRGNALCCDRCGAEERVTPPVPVDVFVFWIRHFEERHASCREAAKE